MKDDIQNVLISEQEIREKVAELGRQISEDYKGKNLMLVSVLKGSVVFMADLMRAITIPCQIDFMCVSSYGSSSKSSGVVKIVKDIDDHLGGKELLIVEDILDSGVTLEYISGVLRGKGATSIRIATLLDKPERRKANVTASYNEQYRNLPYIGVLKPEVYGG